MDEQHYIESDDERLVRTALLAAYPPDRSKFSLRRGEQIIRAAASERRTRRAFIGGRVAASVAAAFTLLAGTAGAAGAALPGQPLYPLKRIVERAMVAVTADDSDAARLELRFAERRLHEASSVTEEPVAETLAERFNEHINDASALAGDEIADDVEELRDAHIERTTDATLDHSPPAASPVTESDPAVSRSPSPSPSPSVSPSPSPSASPSPSPSPSPSAGTEAGLPLPDLSSVVGEVLPGDPPDDRRSPSERTADTAKP